LTSEREPGPLPSFVPGDLPPGPRRVYLAATTFFLSAFVALIWPVYPNFAGLRPVVLGLPFSLVYVVIVLLVTFGVLLGLYVWEDRRGLHDPLDPDAEGSETTTGPGGGD
jgi:fatty acid desaturase